MPYLVHLVILLFIQEWGQSMGNGLLLAALEGKNTSRPPVWLMRQAGRYMPEYRKLREKHTLWQMFHEPEIAFQVTCQPIDILGVDAAILFSDILVIGEALGLNVHFPEGRGPFIDFSGDVKSLDERNPEEALFYVKKTIELLKPELKVPLIGFSGGPFTVASYMIDKGGKGELKLTRKWLAENPQSFHLLLEKITVATIAYLKMQIKAGVNAVQVFDSWAGVLSYEEFHEFCLPYLSKITEALKSTNIPVILFCRGSSYFAADLAKAYPACISLDAHKPLAELRKIIPSSIAVQGNLDPYLLYSSKDKIKEKTRELLRSMQGDPGFIVNLAHGVFPDISVDHVKCLVDTVKEFNAR